MNLLLDSHIFLWYITDDGRLPGAAARAIRQASNAVFLSVASQWELLLKHHGGKLPLPEPADEYLISRRASHMVSTLAVEEGALRMLLTLPNHHRDPFDRMLVCQAVHHDLTLVTVDETLRRYPVKLLPM